MKRQNKTEFWISNISNRNVTLRDLAMSVKARSHVNLLDERHYSFTLDQLEKSAENGSLYNKRHLLKVRKSEPPKPIKKETYLSKLPIFISKNPLFSQLVLEEPKFEELDISETDFIDELTDPDDE